MPKLIARHAEIGVPENIKFGVQVNEKMLKAIIAKAYEMIPDAVAHDKAKLDEERHVVVVTMYVWETPEAVQAPIDVSGLSFESNGDTMRVTDESGDSVLFERPITHLSQGRFLFLANLPDDGVYITRAQWDAITRIAEAWFEDSEAGA